MRLIKGRVFVVPRTGGQILFCLQCVTGTVYAMELQPLAVAEFLDQLDTALNPTQPSSLRASAAEDELALDWLADFELAIVP